MISQVKRDLLSISDRDHRQIVVRLPPPQVWHRFFGLSDIGKSMNEESLDEALSHMQPKSFHPQPTEKSSTLENVNTDLIS